VLLPDGGAGVDGGEFFERLFFEGHGRWWKKVGSNG
jgi:hypothetical protein